jgi:glycosyltransferase involved in cell wall biosynthesis
MKILFYIGGLSSGGKERRLLELMTFLNDSRNYEIILVTQKEEISFENFYFLDLIWIKLSSPKINLSTFYEFFRIIRKYKPEIIHTWGDRQTLVALPSRVFLRNVRLVNSQITSAPPKISFKDKFFANFNFLFSDIILSNSNAGVDVYKPPKHKTKVIYNGLNPQRFKGLSEKEKVRSDYGLDKKFVIVMAASFSPSKDYKLFYEVGKELSKFRNDFIFLGIGYFAQEDAHLFNEAEKISGKYPHLKALPGTLYVEHLVNACDIGLLFSPNGEGLSNSILEYMALGKPVIANDKGGTKEIVVHNENGYLIKNESPKEIAVLIDRLLNDPKKMIKMGRKSLQRINNDFHLEIMGKAFVEVYSSLILNE